MGSNEAARCDVGGTPRRVRLFVCLYLHIQADVRSTNDRRVANVDGVALVRGTRLRWRW